MTYDRNILVPYLENLYHLEMMQAILKKKYAEKKEKLDEYQYVILKNSKSLLSGSDEADKSNDGIFVNLISAVIITLFEACLLYLILNSFVAAYQETGINIITFPLAFLWTLLLGIFFPITFLISWLGDKLNGFETFIKGGFTFIQNHTISAVIVIGIILFLNFLSIDSETENTNIKKAEQQKKLHKEEKERLERLSRTNISMEKIKLQLQELDNKLDKNLELLARAYSVNIIPPDYRNLYAVAYLYRYFSGSQANDLDSIIQTLLLDNIKAQLNDIRSKLSEITTNQLLMQETLYDIRESSLRQEEINKNARDIMEEHAAVSEEYALKRNEYLKMIEINTSVANYLALAEF